ncbi:hypothetical protein [Urbifossiella limnaea]|jgi:hypothetical protein|uniref:Uncharacterized protein n=1 Tax=Urbifossiella limnaea TaxID=2528023 RepID=A0A517XVI5_9BACT|nr:hypothetical protein [Urbifossiella limnaea]QDU21520.1 hypothetical protein ETAA1_34870 [Urbifossiella limnaea]
MRKMLMAVGLALFAVGVVCADPVTLVKYDASKKEVTVKDKDGKEATYKLTEKTKYLTTDKDGNKKEGDAESAAKILGNEKAAGKAKFEITTANGAVTEIQFKRGGKKTN